MKTEFRFPTGKQVADYIGWQNWSNNRWAWEFLKRNKSFQGRCDRIREYCQNKILVKYWKRTVCQCYGLAQYKPYDELYYNKKLGVEPPRFSVASVSASTWRSIKPRNIDFKKMPSRLQPGKVFLCFDIERSVRSSKSIDAQLRQAKQRLLFRQDRWRRLKNIPSQPTHYHKQDFLMLLRILDLMEHNEKDLNGVMTEVEMAEIIFAEQPERDIGSAFSRGKSTADKYRKDFYLDVAATEDAFKKNGLHLKPKPPAPNKKSEQSSESVFGRAVHHIEK